MVPPIETQPGERDEVLDRFLQGLDSFKNPVHRALGEFVILRCTNQQSLPPDHTSHNGSITADLCLVGGRYKLNLSKMSGNEVLIWVYDLDLEDKPPICVVKTDTLYGSGGKKYPVIVPRNYPSIRLGTDQGRKALSFLTVLSDFISSQTVLRLESGGLGRLCNPRSKEQLIPQNQDS